RGCRRVKRRPMVAQLHDKPVVGPLGRDLKRFPAIALQSMVDDVAAALFQRQSQTEYHFFWHALRLREILHRLDGAHDFLRRGLQFQRHLRPPPITFKVKMAMSSDCGAPLTNARTCRSNPVVMSGAPWPEKAAASASNRSLP